VSGSLFDPNKGGAERAMERRTQVISQRLSQVRCPEHNESPSVNRTGGRFSITACCRKMEDISDCGFRANVPIRRRMSFQSIAPKGNFK